MVNKKLLQTAERWMNEEIPTEREKKQTSSKPTLASILQKDKSGKPKLDLTPFEKTAVNTLTQEDYWNLMRVYECGGWKWRNNNLPTEFNAWDRYKKQTCIIARFSFGYADKQFYLKENWNVITLKEFYKRQNPPITQGMLKEINSWFDENAKSKIN